MATPAILAHRVVQPESFAGERPALVDPRNDPANQHRLTRLDGSIRVVALKAGPDGAVLNGVCRDITSASDGFSAKTRDTAASLFGPAVKAEQLSAHAKALAPTLQTAAEKIKAHRERIDTAMRTISITKRSAPDFHDIEIARGLAGLSVGERAQLLARLKTQPYTDPTLIDAVQLTHTLVSHVSPRDKQEIRIAAAKAFLPEAYEALEVERNQLDSAIAVLRASLDVAGEAGMRGALFESAPAALLLAANFKAPEWLPPLPADATE